MKNRKIKIFSIILSVFILLAGSFTFLDNIFCLIHTYGEKITIKEPTYLTSGEKISRCSKCGDTKSYTIKSIEADAKSVFSSNERNVLSNQVGDMPLTYEAIINVPKGATGRRGVILGDNDSFSSCITLEIYKNGNPRLYLRDENKQVYDYVFSKVDVRTGRNLHLTIVHDIENNSLKCYINGKLKQTLTGVVLLESYIPKFNFVVGGDNRPGNTYFFKDSLGSVIAWGDVRSDKEIKADFEKGINFSDENLLFALDMSKRESGQVLDASGNDNMVNEILLWQEEVEPINDYAYSMAVIGDTQTLSLYYPEKMASLYDWIVENKDSQKIEYVMGMGDITQNDSASEWEFASSQIYKLDGVVPFSVIRGNHDSVEQFNETFSVGNYYKQVDGYYEAGDFTNTYRTIEIAGTKYLILCLDYGPTDDALEWAGEVISEHSDYSVVITTHAYLYRDGTTLDINDKYAPTLHGGYNNGDDIWDKLVRKYSNILLVLCGHDPWDHIVCTQSQGDNGNTVTQMLIDPQYMDVSLDGTAMIAMLYFSEDGKTITVRYYSIDKDMYGSELSQFTIEL